MPRRRLLQASIAISAPFLLQTTAFAQAQTMGPVTGGTVVQPTLTAQSAQGVQVSDGVMLHSGVGAEGGYDSNVFYEEFAPAGAAQVRVTPFLELTNTPRTGEIPTGLYFSARAALTYRKYISDDEAIRRVPGFMPTVNAILEHNSGGAFSVGVSETYARLEDAPYFRGTAGMPQDPIRRNNNVAAAQARWSPGGGRLQTLLRYTNTLDWFETNDLRGRNSLGHEGMLDLAWRWLPKTALYFQVRQGYISYWNQDAVSASGPGVSSYPLRAIIGLRGLVTEKTSVTIAAGYQKGFYSGGAADTSGFLGSTLLGAEATFLPVMSTRIVLGARHEFQNSIIGNFYYDDGAYLTLAEQLAGRLVAQLWGRYDYRRYYGIPGATEPRRDHVTQAGATLDFFVRKWAFLGASYALTVNRSDYATEPAATGLTGLNYTKHVVLGRIGVTY